MTKNILIPFFQLIRWKNLTIIALVQLMVRLCILGPVYKTLNIEFALSWTGFAMLVFSGIFLAAGGYVINDFFDVRIDRVNKPGTMVLTKFFTLRSAITLHLILTSAGLVSGIGAALSAGSFKLVGFQAAIAAALWFYASRYKHHLLVGNLVVAILTGLVPAIVWLFEFYALQHQVTGFSALIPWFSYINQQVLLYAAFAFLINFIREMIKDVLDIGGDTMYGSRTVPIVWGIENTARMASITGLVSSVLILFFLPVLKDGYARYSLLYILVFIELPLLWIIVKLLRKPDKKVWAQSASLLKAIMLSGVMHMIFYLL